MNKPPILFVSILLGLGLPMLAYANIPMSLLIPFTKYVHWLLIPLIILIEALAIRWIFSFTWKRALFASIVVNIVSALLGVILYPLATGYLFFYPDKTSTIGFLDFSKLVILIGIVDTMIELLVLKYAFKIYVGGKYGAYFLITNLLTTALIYVVVYV